jgi:hypothetical protein
MQIHGYNVRVNFLKFSRIINNCTQVNNHYIFITALVLRQVYPVRCKKPTVNFHQLSTIIFNIRIMIIEHSILYYDILI